MYGQEIVNYTACQQRAPDIFSCVLMLDFFKSDDNSSPTTTTTTVFKSNLDTTKKFIFSMIFQVQITFLINEFSNIIIVIILV